MEKAKLNIYQKLQKMRVELQKKGLVKSGKNTYSNYEYFELSDFLPHINEIQAENNTVSLFAIDAESAILTIFNCENTEEWLRFTIPIAELALKGANAIQNVGGLTTYCRRYLYMIAFEIAENDEFDKAPQGEPEPPVIYVDEVKIKVLKDKMAKKGVKDNQILDRYNAGSFEELTVIDFMKACSGLDKMPDVEKEQVNIF